MSCRRICRELLWLARFGEFGPSSAPHLDHLAHCAHCRDEVGFDRALVQQLRVALARRIEDAAPSPRAWGVILARTQAPEIGLAEVLHERMDALAGRLRTATAVAAMALAGVIATSTHVAITHPQAGSAETEVVRSAEGELFESQPTIPRPRTQASPRTPVVYVAVAAPSDPEAAFMASLWSANVASQPIVETEPPAEESAVESSVLIGPDVGPLTSLDDPPVSGSDPEPSSVAPRGDAAAGEPF